MSDGLGAAEPAVRQTVATDGDAFMLATPGATGRVVRTGRGADHAAVHAWGFGAAQLALLEMGFPAVAEAEVVGRSLVLATMLQVPEGGRWDGVDLEVGQTFVYPTGSAHHGQDPGGLAFALTVLPWCVVERAALDLGVDPAMGTRRHVVRGGPLWELVAPLARVARGAASGRLDDRFVEDRILESAVRTVCGTHDVAGGPRRPRGWSDADLVRDGLAVLDELDAWIVPVLTLCRAVCVSERRLQAAFAHLLGIGPRAFMHHRALQAAHRALRAADPASTLVADVARAHGFRHLGRFAAAYREVYGERPSRTLGRPPT